ncbi:hypothetical protein TUM19329_09550 [Legionella antarctica]|uniref:Methyltransferase domain-containing protein n=1 Tax=Legionella antarctica TaxID=2708020 RepID=A0A6F8T1N6_9GAMM|nr:class I SAM-dependent methyltransferase [Legionella antarctica]BCA94594.1 hypothetical protein TUM19329_09550 [Legionella antarctica]
MLIYTHNNYEMIRQSIANDVLNFMQKQSNPDVLLLDIGTGLGDCLDLTMKMMQTLPVKFRAIGIDPNEQNIRAAQTKFPGYVFKIGQAHSLEKIVEEEKFQNNMKHALVVIIASGSITRLVINNTFEALEIFQQAHRVADLMVLGGENEVLITRKNAKKIGWNAQYHPSKLNDSNLVYLLTRKVSHFPKIREGHLNLSLHANPLLMFNHYGTDLKKVTSIDLGLAYIKKEEIEPMLQLMPQLKNLKISGLEKWKYILEREIKKQEREIVASANVDDYVDTELDSKRWELKKFTSIFYRQHSKLFALFKRSITSLDNGMNSPDYKPNSKEKPQEYIARLESLAIKGDDIAVYVLAKKLGEDVTSENYKNLQISARYWSQLHEKGYPVLFELINVQKLIEPMNPLQDFYNKINAAISKLEPK